MTRVVLDANIYVSAAHFGGVAEQVLLQATSTPFRVVCSASIRAEVERVLEEKLGWSLHRVSTLELSIWRAVIEIAPSAIPRICRDPKDDHVLAVCSSGDADILVTGDKDLLVLGHFGKTEIMTPRRFLDEFVTVTPTRSE